MTPRVTVLMTVFNGQSYLNAAIDSVLAQTFTDFELLVVDDCSTDNTPAILKAHAKADSRVRVIRNHANQGQTVSLAYGLDLACGSLIARLDADDVALPQRLERQVAFLDDRHDFSVMGTACDLIDKNGTLIGERRHGYSHPKLVALLPFFNPLIHSSIMFRRDDVKRIGGYDVNFPRAQDYDLWLRCVASGLKVIAVDEVLVCQRMHEARVTHTQSKLMEECRRKANRFGWKHLASVDVDDEMLDLLEALQWLRDKPRIDCFKSVIVRLRRLAQAFYLTHSDDPLVRDAFRSKMQSVVNNLCICCNREPALYLKYVEGRAVPVMLLEFNFLSVIQRNIERYRETMLKSWIYNCRPMRRLRAFLASRRLAT